MANSPAANRARIAAARSEGRAKGAPGEAWAKMLLNSDDMRFAERHGRLVKNDQILSSKYQVKPKEL